MTSQARKSGPSSWGEMAKAYDPKQVEGPLYRLWLEGGYFTPQIDPAKKPFTIIMPPPNVTGELHLGHALTATIEDLLVRWHRMKGDPTLWLPGVDHAGIATQNVVEKELLKEGLSRHDLGRDGFVERVWEWVRKYRHIITRQHEWLGASCDWTRERFTMDEGPQRAVRTTFVNLYRDGLIYRGERIVNWCPRCQTALSDLEVEHKEHADHLWYVRYPLLDEGGEPSDECITIATTRPETIVADVAVAVNPDDPRHQDTIGRLALLPIMGRRIPVVGDAAVDPAFGTGALKITPGHDQVDFEVGERYGLRTIVAVGPDGRMNEEAGPYAGQDRFECRQSIVRDLEAMGLMEKIEPYGHSIGHCERCDTVVEPIVSQQWFVSMKRLAEPAMQAVKDGQVKILPRRFTRVYLHWMENIRDWCISRQLWWGHRIPVWYCDDCHQVTVPRQVGGAPSTGSGGTPSAGSGQAPSLRSGQVLEDPSQCEHCGSARIWQDPDVLDTWFSSALWPHSTLGWPDDSQDLRYFYPTTVLETAYDILFFWVARMIMMGLYNLRDRPRVEDRVPFQYVYLHGLIRDPHGRKMTKSLGNVVDPLMLAERFGTDALRFVLATGGAPGNDMRITDERLEGGRNFANKVWNGARFVITSLEQETEDKEQVPLPDPGRRGEMALEDRWIMSRLHRVIGDVEKLLTGFQVGEAGRQVHDFFWGEFCDWYIEMAKVRLKASAGGGPASGGNDRSPLPLLAHVLDASLRLLHPFMPFITEAIWQNLRGHLASPHQPEADPPLAEAEALVVAPWPRADERWQDEEAERDAQRVIDVVRAIRNIRAERGVEPARYVEAYVVADSRRPATESSRPIIETLARVRPLRIVDGTADAPRERVITAVLRDVQVVVPLTGLFDVEAERGRLDRQVQEADAEMERLAAKLANEQFRAKAPAEVVSKEEERLAAARARLEGLQARLKELG